jgi:flagellar motor switch/type III secretory pathway protein FliN
MAAALAVPPVPPAPVAADRAWQEAAELPCRLAAEITVRGFTVGDLLSLEAGSLVDTGIAAEADVTVRVNGARVGCGKLASAGNRRGVRLTELG